MTDVSILFGGFASVPLRARTNDDTRAGRR